MSSVQPGDLDALVIPGGYAPDRMRRDESLLTLVRGVAELDRLVAFVCRSKGVLLLQRTLCPNAGADAPDVMRGCAGVPAPAMATRCRWPERGARC